jgi:small multidrug resistance family-3 protein
VAGASSWTASDDRYDLAGAIVCLVGVAVIMYAPRGA